MINNYIQNQLTNFALSWVRVVKLSFINFYHISIFQCFAFCKYCNVPSPNVWATVLEYFSHLLGFIVTSHPSHSIVIDCVLIRFVRWLASGSYTDYNFKILTGWQSFWVWETAGVLTKLGSCPLIISATKILILAVNYNLCTSFN